MHYPYVHCSIIYNSQDIEATRWPSIDESIKKMQYIYAIEFYLTIKTNEILPFATTRMDLEGIMLSE